jgi:hypothetical protein
VREAGVIRDISEFEMQATIISDREHQKAAPVQDQAFIPAEQDGCATSMGRSKIEPKNIHSTKRSSPRRVLLQQRQEGREPPHLVTDPNSNSRRAVKVFCRRMVPGELPDLEEGGTSNEDQSFRIV